MDLLAQAFGPGGHMDISGHNVVERWEAEMRSLMAGHDEWRKKGYLVDPRTGLDEQGRTLIERMSQEGWGSPTLKPSMPPDTTLSAELR